MLLAIDPGSAAPGPACVTFADREVVTAFFSYAPPVVGVTVILIERPEDHGLRSRRARPADLMALAWCGGLAAGFSRGLNPRASIVEAAPSVWKGSEPKPIHHARLWKVLGERERAVLGGDSTGAAIAAAVAKGAARRWAIAGAECYPRAFKTQNWLDAAALGCWHLGRLAKR